MKELVYDVKLYNYAVKSTIEKINVDFEHGQFYYIWLNVFLRDVDIAVWNGTYDSNRKSGLDDKKSSKAADITRSELTKWFKETFK